MNPTTTPALEGFPHALKIAPGQIWREVDKRFSRHVRIVTVLENSKAVIYTVNPVNLQKCGPITQARVDRFSGRRGGYELVREAC